MTLDHVIPRCAGGTDETHNLVSACSHCNQSKSHENWRSWYSRQSFYDPYKESQILEWQKQNINTEERAGRVLTRNNFVHKKLKNN